MAARPRRATSPRLRGGAGVVIGVVDSGIAPESPAFAEVPGLGRDPRDFAGACAEGEGWSADDCTRKVVGARWFVDGFGADRVRSSESLSARDVLGHGTQVSSVAAGNAGVSVRVDGRDAGRFGGVAPQARIAAYKACWGAPDPADDGCSTADVVAAVDAAVADRVDVLNLALAGGEGIDTLQRALLGAAEADIVVIGAAGNAGRVGVRRARGPWVTTVGSAVGRMSRGADRRSRAAAPGPAAAVPSRWPDAPCWPRTPPLPGSRAARPASAAAAPSTPAWSPDASWCAAGAASAASTSPSPWPRPAGAPWCWSTCAPAPSRPTSTPSRPSTCRGRRPPASAAGWPATPAPGCGCPASTGDPGTRRTAPWSASGDPRGSALKPDAVADGDAVLGALPESSGRSWGVFSGSSAATAHASGLAALLLAEHDWSAAVVRSLLVTSASPIRGSSVLTQGSGALPAAPRPPTSPSTSPAGAWRRALRTHAPRRAQHQLAPAPARRQRRAVRTRDQRRHPPGVLLGHRPRLHLPPRHACSPSPYASRRGSRPASPSRCPGPPLPAASTTASWCGSAPSAASPGSRSR